jgi:anti-sigma B factor antagonist
MIRGLPVVAAPEEIDVSNADWLRIYLLESAARGHATLVVDMTRFHFCDSAGLHVLVRVHKRALAEGGELRLVIPCVAGLRAVAVTGVDRVIPHFPTLDEALPQPPAVMIRLRRRGPSLGMRVLAELMSGTPDTGTRPEPLADLGVSALRRRICRPRSVLACRV